MRAVPMSLREGSFAMGATRLQTAIKVVFPAAISGIAAAYVLGISPRGRRDNDPRGRGGHAAQPDVQPDGTRRHDHGVHPCRWRWATCHTGPVALPDHLRRGLTLFLLTLVFNLIGLWMRKRFRQAY